MSKTTDVAIIGGGVIGCSIAYQLAKRGVECTVFDKDRFASGASGATAGIVGPIWYVDHSIKPYFELGMRSLKMFPTLTAELKEAGVDPEFQQNGVVQVALTDELNDLLHENLVWQGELGIGVHWIDRHELLEREPEITPVAQGGVLSPKEGSIVGKAFVDALVHAASRLGTSCLEGVEVTGLEMDGDKVIGVRTLTETYHSNHTILAAGPWTGLAKRWLPQSIPVRPVKGQRILLRKPGFLPRCSVQSIVPQLDGCVISAATREENIFDQVVTAVGVAHMVSKARDVFPVLKDAEFISATAGVRPGTPDGMPILGPVPGWGGLSIASGHDRVGIILSPVTGELIADYVVTGDDSKLEPFSITRFGFE